MITEIADRMTRAIRRSQREAAAKREAELVTVMRARADDVTTANEAVQRFATALLEATSQAQAVALWKELQAARKTLAEAVTALKQARADYDTTRPDATAGDHAGSRPYGMIGRV